MNLAHVLILAILTVCKAEIEKGAQSGELNILGAVANEKFDSLYEKSFYRKHSYPLSNIYNLDLILE